MAKIETPEQKQEYEAIHGGNGHVSNLDGFEELFPEGINITLRDGKRVNIQAFDFDEIAEAARLVVEFGVAFDRIDFSDPAVILGLMTRNTEPVLRLVSLFVRRNLMANYPDEFKSSEDVYQYIKKRKGIEGVKIGTAGVKMNYDFFGQAKSVVTTLFPGVWAKQSINQQTSEQEKTGSSLSHSSDEGGLSEKSVE